MHILVAAAESQSIVRKLSEAAAVDKQWLGGRTCSLGEEWLNMHWCEVYAVELTRCRRP